MLKLTLIFLTLFLSSQTFSYDYPVENLSSPRDSFNYFLKTMKGHKLGDDKGLDLATKVLNVSYMDEDIRDIKAREYSIKLINILDKIERIDVSLFPQETQLKKWYYRQEFLSIEDKKVSAEISMELNSEKEWKFTRRTLESLESYETYLKDKNIVKNVVKLNDVRTQLYNIMPAWAFNETVLLKNIQWIGLVISILIAFILDRIIKLYIASQIVSLLAKKNITITEKSRNKLSSPVGLLVFAYTFKSLIGFLDLPENMLLIFTKIAGIIIVVATIMALIQLIDFACMFLERKAKVTENKFDDILVPLIRKTLRFFVYSLGIILIGDALSLNMKNILAGMGIGGIAFALAAKDTISNLFGSFTVLVDRPFSIGDWVKINGNIEGVIVEVGLRSTRVKTFYDSIITVPNGSLTNAYIDNYGKRQFRRYTTKLALDYSTPVEKIENFCEGIRQLIIKHPHTRKDYFHVYFTDMGASSLDVLLYVFWQVPDWSSELNERQNLLLDIMRLAKKMNISFAFPTQTLNIIQEDKLSYTKEEVDFDKSKNIVEEIAATRKLIDGHRSDEGSCR